MFRTLYITNTVGLNKNYLIADTRNDFRLPSGRPSQALIHSWFKLDTRKADVDKMNQNATNFSPRFIVFFLQAAIKYHGDVGEKKQTIEDRNWKVFG